MTNTPTYDQLSALCARMAAAVESYKHAMEGFAQAVRQDTGLAYPWPAQELSLPALEAALTAYHSMSPDPQWQRVPEGCVVVPEAATLEMCRYVNSRCDTPDIDLAWTYPEWLTAANRARGEG